MHRLGLIFATLGGQGPVLLVASLIAGVLYPDLAQAGYAALPFSAFLLTLGSFLTAGISPAETKISPSLVAIVLCWLGLGIPTAAAAILALVPLDPSLRAGALLSLLAPPVGSAAAIAAMLGLQPRLALIASIALTIAAPFTMPGFAALFGLGISMNTTALAVRLLAIVGIAALVAFAALRFRDRLRPILPDQRAAAGVAVIGLIIVGLAASQSVRAHWNADPSGFERMLAAAIGLNFGMCAIGAAVFSRLGLRAAATVGLVSGNRNVTLAWAATSFGLPPLAEGYLAACVVPVLALPLIVKFGVALPSLARRLIPQISGSARTGSPRS